MTTQSFTILGTVTLMLCGAMIGGAAEKGLLDKLMGHEPASSWTGEELETALSVKDFLGRKVVDEEGRELGKVKDVTLQDRHGGFDKAVIEVGGFLDWNKALIAVPYGQIQHPSGTRNLVWNITRQDFQALVDQSKERPTRTAASKHPSHKPELSGSGKEARSNTPAGRTAVSDTTNASDPLIRKAMQAIREDDKLSGHDRDIRISREKDHLVVRGEVESAQIKNHILLVVKKVTATDVVDELIVK